MPLNERCIMQACANAAMWARLRRFSLLICLGLVALSRAESWIDQGALAKARSRKHGLDSDISDHKKEHPFGSIVEIYEKVALAGSEVRLVCPHVAAHPVADSFASFQRKQTYQQTARQQQRLDNYHAETSESLDPHSVGGGHTSNGREQIRWFRNHVPLLNNYSPHERHKELGQLNEFKDVAAKARLEHGFRSRGAEIAFGELESGRKDDTVHVTSGKLNQTAEPVLRYGKDVGNYKRFSSVQADHVYAKRQREKLQVEHAFARRQTLLKTNGNELYGNEQFGMLNSQTVMVADINNAKPVQQLNNKENSTLHVEPRWFINSFGELVLTRVDQNLSGSYTCLHDGHLSEVLLDVVLGEESNLDSSLAKSESENLSSHKRLGMDSVRLIDDTEMSGPTNYDKVAHSMLKMPNKMFKAETGDDIENDLPPLHKVSGHYEGYFLSNEKKPHQEQLVAPILTTRSRTGQATSSSIQTSAAQKSPGNEVQTDSNSFSRSFTHPARRHARWTSSDAVGHHPQNQPRLHIVESEIIANHDLESVPGLLYTKQQFFCPLMSQVDLLEAIENQVNLLIGDVCRPQEANGQYLACSKLANRLMAQLIEFSKERSSSSNNSSLNGARTSHESKLDCFSTTRALGIINIVWYKDGTKLSFDPDGRGTDKKLNVKLIDFIDQPDGTSHSAPVKPSKNSKLDKPIDILRSRREILSFMSVRERDGSQREKSGRRTPEHRHYNVLCPPRGLILEIDGIRRLNAGRYTCALEFNNAVLRNCSRTLKRLQLARLNQIPTNGNDSSKTGCSVGKIDKSNCNDHVEELHDIPPASPVEDVLRTQAVGRTVPDQVSMYGHIDQVSFAHGQEVPSNHIVISPMQFHNERPAETNQAFAEVSAVRTGNAPEASAAENQKVPPDNTKQPFESRQIITLESMLNGSVDLDEESWTYFEREFFNSQPSMIVQSFLLIINERPANSCSLWSSIREANDAYSRRKLTDFRRLKRSLMKPASGLAISANVDEQQRRGQTRKRRQENLNDSGERLRIGRHYPEASANGPRDYARGGAGNIDGKLVASLSWSNGATGSGAIPGFAEAASRTPERRHDDIENARQSPDFDGRQNSFELNESVRGNGREEVPAERVSKMDGIRHRSKDPLEERDADMRANGPSAFGVEEIRMTDMNRSNYPNNEDIGRVSAEELALVANNADKQLERASADVRQDRTQSERGALEDGTNPFNYANERNLNLRLESRPRGPGRAPTFDESFDLHPDTFDPKQPVSRLSVLETKDVRATEIDQTPDARSSRPFADEYLEAANKPKSLHEQRRAETRTSDGRSERRAKSVIDDSHLLTSRVDDQDDAIDSDEVANEVSDLKPNGNGQVRAGFGQAESGKLFDLREASQTNSPCRPVGSHKFVTEKSNIYTESVGAFRKREQQKFNNIVTVHGPAAKTSDGRSNGGNFINSSPLLKRPYQRTGLVGASNDQSNGGRKLVAASTSLPLLDGALSIGHDGRQPYESEPESRHKLQLAKTERRRRFGQSDKSARSADAIASGPVRRRLRRQTVVDDGRIGRLETDQVSLASAREVKSKTKSSSSDMEPPSTSSGIQYEVSRWRTNASDDGDTPPSSTAGTLRQGSVTSPEAIELPAIASGLNGQLSNTGDENIIKDGDFIRGVPLSTTASANAENDENLLWTAAQYLYLHLRAYAASSIYGVQVDVEWSNENEKRAGTNQSSSNDGLSLGLISSSASPRSSSSVPIATIELVSGQNLYLQCTAQAFGRLPAVSWYKKVTHIPAHIPEHLRKQKLRSLGRDIFWPVTSLDLLDEDDYRASKQFICSQSLTIFDNLLNQTFTVVNNLKLSERKLPEVASLNEEKIEEIDEGHHSLFACMVEADVRNEYATLGVNIRHASSKLPRGLGKRIGSQSLPANDDVPGRLRMMSSTIVTDAQSLESNYNSLRQNQIIVPFRSAWVPIRKNGGQLDAYDDFQPDMYTNQRLPLSPIVLAFVIASLACLLIALVYFTMRSYKALTSFQSDDECSESIDRKDMLDIGLETSNVAKSNSFTATTTDSYCSFNPSKTSYEHKISRPDESDYEDFLSVTLVEKSIKPKVFNPPFANQLAIDSGRQKPFYEAHFHDASLICDEIPASLLTTFLADGIKDELVCSYENDCRDSNSACCATQQHHSALTEQSMIWTNSAQNRVNMVDNPLNHL